MLTTLKLLGAEPVSVAEAKLAARVDGNELDSFIATAIAAARESAEQITDRSYRQKVQRQSFVDWPASSFVFPVFGVTAVEVRYWEGDQWVLLDDAAVAFFEAGMSGTGLAPALGTSWPALGEVAGGPRVRVDLTSGPTGADGEPPIAECVKHYINANVAAWVKNPEAIASNTLVAHPLLRSLLDSECLWM